MLKSTNFSRSTSLKPTTQNFLKSNKVSNISSGANILKRSTHSLPPLDYPLENGLGETISARQLDFHYNKHHATYVNKLNDLIKGTEHENTPLMELVIRTAFNEKKTAIFNNAAQHFNHSFYWKCMTPEKQQMPENLKTALEKNFGSVEQFQEEFQSKATSNFGSGWTWLVNKDNSLYIVNTSNAMTPIAEKIFPLLTVDVWEHAYYLDHQNRRPEYLKKFWDITNWKFVASNLEKAQAEDASSENINLNME
eukprot:gb/GECH01011532.1/.p1 GENE.gb/GECH01011532.1/~~gb/GECH01011532.1/.p1  ORF type:complete len:252 (+),score=54.45 gb/GECH01011532.1/:1-756(+)